MFSPSVPLPITLFHRRVSKCRPPAASQVSHLLKIYHDTNEEILFFSVSSDFHIEIPAKLAVFLHNSV
jgi:hypothetical protein